MNAYHFINCLRIYGGTNTIERNILKRNCQRCATCSRFYIYDSVFLQRTDNVSDSKYSIPTHWDIGKVYKRLIIDICVKQGKESIETLVEVYNSWLSRKIEDFNSSLYYENPGYLYESYLEGDVL